MECAHHEYRWQDWDITDMISCWATCLEVVSKVSKEDWAGMSLPEVVQLARDRGQYRQIVHMVAKAPHGV